MGTDLPFRVSGLFMAGIVNRKRRYQLWQLYASKSMVFRRGSVAEHICSPPLVGRFKADAPEWVIFLTEWSAWQMVYTQKAPLFDDDF
jgi:hypothetical protein